MTTSPNTADGIMPLMGLGTYGRRGKEGQAAIESAIEIGYRHLDTAQDYNTEDSVGAAMKASGLPRSEFFVTTKVATGNLGAGKLIPSVEHSLKTLGVDQIDLLLIHWPSPRGEVPLETYITQIAEAFDKGLAKHIGVSNFTIDLIDRTLEMLDGRPLVTNQVEVHPYLQNRKLVSHCRAKGVGITCYMPLAQGRIGADPTMQAIAKQHGATSEQVSLAYLMDQDMPVIPSSANTDRLRQNFAALNVRLTEEDKAKIDALERGMRIINPAWSEKWD